MSFNNYDSQNHQNGSTIMGVDDKKPVLRIAKNIYHINAFSKFLSIFSLLAVFIIVIYFCFALTIIRILPASNMGFVSVKTSTFSGGVASYGDNIIVDTKSSEGSGMLDHLKQATIPNSHIAKAKVLSGPYGKITWENINKAKINGRVISLNHHTYNKAYLNNEYVVNCLDGDCKKGDNFIISSNNIIGQPLSNK